MSDHTKNPPVNRCLKDKAMDHIDHALGRPAWPLRESYRNYFATEADGPDGRSFAGSPYWERGGTSPGGLTSFYVTQAGREALAKHLSEIDADRVYLVTYEGFETIVPAASPAKARYNKWLDLRDVLPDLPFLDFSRDARVRLAP